VQITDAPLDNLVKFEITVVSIELGPGDVEVLPEPVRVELTSLQLSTAVIRLAETVPVGSYNQVTIIFSDPEIKFCPENVVCTESNLQEIEPALTNSTVEKTVSFSISGSSGTALLIDFDLEGSVETAPVTGAITGVDPQVTCTTQTLGAEDDEFEAKGRVLAITRDTSTTGSFVLEAFGSCQRITVTVDGVTEFEDFDPDLNNTFESLAVDQIVEVEADAEADGLILANTVELEEPDDDEEAEGTIIDVVRAAGGEVIEFTLLAQELATCATGVLTDDIITVTVNDETSFEVDEDLTGLAAFFNSAEELAVGQKVEVEPTGLLATEVIAEKIQLKEQVVLGSVFTTAPPLTFTMFAASEELFFEDGDGFIEVQTSGATEFDGVSGVNELIPLQEVRVRGLVFFVGGQLVVDALKVEAEPIGGS
jgi:hypothetical protein